ncbi:hypothetical protein QM565_14020 [Geitlerinema splendidum]|nr:hypothetical protein [Geitlerinema splendidum]
MPRAWQLDKQRKLHKWLDPVAGQLLEASALHWDRVHTILSGSSWQNEELGGHWVAIREKSLKAADLAMAEILMLCARCVGEPTKNRSDDWKDILEDFAELDFEDAIRGLNKAIATDSKSYKFTSPEARIVFEPARQIAERLKQLADQVEQSAQQAALEITIPHGSYATESIDVLLGEFRSISMAESELDSSQRLEH